MKYVLENSKYVNLCQPICVQLTISLEREAMTSSETIIKVWNAHIKRGFRDTDDA